MTALADCPLDIDPLSYKLHKLHSLSIRKPVENHTSHSDLSQRYLSSIKPPTSQMHFVGFSRTRNHGHLARQPTSGHASRPGSSLSSNWLCFGASLGRSYLDDHGPLLRVASCQSRAEFWRNRFNGPTLMRHLLGMGNMYDGMADAGVDIARRWKGLAAMVDSFDE